jgi:tetratricopeptide (TPR) repeat protein
MTNKASARRSLLPFIFSVVLLSCAAFEARAQETTTANEKPPQTGLRLLEVLDRGPAQTAGLRPMDIIVRYGDFPVVDAASYFAARDTIEKSRTPAVIVYWRGGAFLEAQASGHLGIKFDEYNPANFQLDALMQRLNLLIEVADYPTDIRVAKGAPQSREQLTQQIEAAIKQAFAAGSLTPAQALVARINSYPDDAGSMEIEKQSELLKELFSSQPRSFTDYLGYEVFFRHKRYRPAVACFKRTLEANRMDANSRLNMGLAYSHLEMFVEADAAADYALKESPGLTEHGYLVAFEVKTEAALGQRDFAKAMNYAEQAFKLNPSSTYLMSVWQLAAAQNGDLEKFYEVAAATQKALPAEMAGFRSRFDALEAYVLAKNNQIEKARALVAKWIRTETSDANARYWKQYPSGADVAKTWKELQTQN